MKDLFCICFFTVIIFIILPFSSVCAQEPKGKGLPAMLFQEKGAGYTIEYPGDWVYERSADGVTFIFSGPSGTKAYHSTVSIQNLLSEKSKAGKYRDADAVVNDLLSLFEKQNGFTKSAVKPFTYSKGPLRLTGKQFSVEYSVDKHVFRQWVIVLPRPRGEIFHVWFYTSPALQYDEFSGTARAMLDSWIILE